MFTRRPIAAVVSALLLLTSTGNAQIPSLGETIEVAIVNLDVVVTDAKGNHVRGLAREDFEVYEDGKLQPLSHFAEYRGAAESAPESAETTAAAAEPAPDQPSQRRTLVLFIEKFKLSSDRVELFVDSIKDLVRKTIRSGDSVSLVTFDGRAKMLVASTSDVSLVERHLDDFGRMCVGPIHEKTASATVMADEVRKFDDEAAAIASARGIRSSRPSPEDVSVNAARIHAMGARLEMNRRVATINTLIKGLAGIEGKKMLVLASHRIGEYVGAEYYYAAGVPDGIIPPGERMYVDNREAVRGIVANANASGVTVYPVFPTGLDAGRPADPSLPDISQYVLMNETWTLQEIAEGTGGLTSFGTAKTARLMSSVAEDMSDYYSVAYRAPARNSDSARKIAVKMKDKTLKVRARREFVEKSNDTEMRDRVLAMLHGAPIESTFQLQAELGATRKVSRKTQTAPLSVRIPIKALTLVPQGRKHSGAFTIYAMSGGNLGEVSEVTRRTQSFDIPANDLERANASYFTYDFDVQVSDQTQALAVGVIDEVSKESGFISVPVARR